MSSLNRMKYAPLQSGFAVDLGSDVISQQLDGGAPRFRRMSRGSVHLVTVGWKVKSEAYQYLLAFYRVWQRNPAQAFLVEMSIDDTAIQEYRSFFVPGSFKLVSKNGDLFTLSAQIAVEVASTVNDVLDDLLVIINNDGTDLDELWSLLAELSNESLPRALGV